MLFYRFLSSSKKRIPFLVLFLLISVEFFLIALTFAGQGSEGERAFFLGYSILRFSTIVVLSLVAIVFMVLFVSLIRGVGLGVVLNDALHNVQTRLRVLQAVVVFGGICWIVFFIPAARFGAFENHLILIRPLLLLGILVSFQLLLYIVWIKDGKREAIQQFLAHNKKELLVWAGVSAICMLLWAYISISRKGLIANNEDYWYEAGVPVLGSQVLLGLLIGLLFTKLENSGVLGKRFFPKGDLLIFTLIWLIGGFLWAQTPVPNGFLNPGPYPPAYETYPYADAARFDLMSQYALIGEGLNNGKAYNRPVYPAFLVYIHLLSGQNYESNMQLQAALFGVFPALIYLIAKILFNRGSGVTVATIIIMRGVNGIVLTNVLNLANQKQMLTDFPTAIGLGATLLFCILWVKNPGKMYLPLLAGCFFGITLYLRQTILGFLPVILLFPIAQKIYSRKTLVTLAGIFFVGIFVVIVPYEFKNFIFNSNYTYPAMIRKITSVVVKRYPHVQPNTLHGGRNDNDLVNKEENLIDNGSVQPLTGAGDLSFIGSHFLHNIITSTLVLPSSFVFENLKRNVTSENSPWKVSWDGHLQFVQSFVLFLNILLISLGITSSIKKQLLTGMMPLLFFVGYNLANALGRTSGGRYIVPVDWVVVLYFSMGLFQVCIWTLNFKRAKKDPFEVETRMSNENVQPVVIPPRLSVLFLCLFVPSALLILPDFIFPKQIKELSPIQISEEFAKHDLTYNQAYLEKLLESKEIIVSTGKLLYPRYYLADMGEPLPHFPYLKLDYPRLAFYLIGSNGTQNVLLAGPLPKGLRNMDKVIVIGCKEKEYVDAVLIILEGADQRVYFREPLLDSACSLP